MADFTDPKFEFFDAPKYVDFTDMDNLMEDDGADKWFDRHQEDDDCEFEDSFVPVTTLTTPAHLIEEDAPDVAVKQEPDATSRSDRTVDQGTTEEEKHITEKTKDSKLKGFYQTLVVGVPKIKPGVAKKNDQSLKERRSPRVAAQKANTNLKTILSKRQSPIKRMERKAPSGSQQEAKTTEELQMNEIKRLQMETRKKLRQSRRSFRKLAHSSGPITVKGSKPTTEAKEFNFHGKNKEHLISVKSEGVNTTNFPAILRSSNTAEAYNPNNPPKPPTPVTKVKPFKFHLDERLNQRAPTHHSQGGEVPTAEAILKYEKTTPPRFRRNPTPSKKSAINTSSGSCGSGGGPSKSVKVLTMPKTPKLMSRDRSRPVTTKSAVEEEADEVAKMKEYQFKANPINPDIFRFGGLLGVPRKRTITKTTEAHTPELLTKKRCVSRRAEEQEETKNFHANPMPNFEKIKGVPEKRVIPITEPDSPAITAKKQHVEGVEAHTGEESSHDHVLKANPAPDLSKAFKVELPHRVLQVKPFTFEERDKEKPTRETLVQRILRNEKKPEFKAQPLPDFGGAPALPPKPHLLPTKVEPFSLRTEVRGQQYSVKLQEKVEQETQALKEDTEFKAQEPTVLYNKPFVPKKSNKPLANIDNVHLHTELRSEKRAKFDAERFRKDREIAMENLKRRALRQAEEAKEIAQFRKSLVHKAQPIHCYEPVVIHGSDRPITQPLSPHFLTDERLRK